MRANKFGIRGMKSAWVKGWFVYFWMPPMSLQKAGVFRHTTLGTDFDIAVTKACEWNEKLDAHRGVNNCVKPTLGLVIPMTVADLFRKYEKSPRFTWYVARTREDYACFYRLPETTRLRVALAQPGDPHPLSGRVESIAVATSHPNRHGVVLQPVGVSSYHPQSSTL
jgi:hypothetical protein